MIIKHRAFDPFVPFLFDQYQDRFWLRRWDYEPAVVKIGSADPNGSLPATALLADSDCYRFGLADKAALHTGRAPPDRPMPPTQAEVARVFAAAMTVNDDTGGEN